MLKKIIIPILALFIFSCGQQSTETVKDAATVKHDSLLAVIWHIEKGIESSMKNTVLDPTLAAKALMNYTQFAQLYPKDTNSAMFLFKAADISGSAMKQYDQSVALLEKILADYPDFKKRGACYFQLGLIYDDYLNDDVKAKKYYEEFIAKYPNSPMVPQVQALISYLGKTNDELIKGFEQKNK